jgi:deoxyribonuclease V
MAVIGVQDRGLSSPPVPTTYAAVDVFYPSSGGATAALVTATEPTFASYAAELVVHHATANPYRPGAFYERELPPLRAVLTRCTTLDLLIVDGYVTLDPAGRPGLGHHVRDELDVPVIGVAKTAFRGATHAVEVYRGRSRRPLFITAGGLAVADAAELVRAMAGEHRLPDALKRVDTLSRSGSTD